MNIKLTLLSSIIGLGTITSGIMPFISPIDNIENYKVLDIDFDKNKIINNVNNEAYSLENKLGKGKFTPSIKGNGLQFNKDAILIPNNKLNINNNTETVTVSFLYKFDGTDENGYPISFGNYNLLIHSKNIGFNTNNSDIYGLAHNFKKGETYNIIAEFNKSDVTKNKIYINGVKQNLHQINEKPHNSSNAIFTNNIAIGKIYSSSNELYYIDDSSIIDEIKMFTKKVTDEEAKIISSSHRIPELTVENENGKARLNWALEILDEDVLWNVGYEDKTVVNFAYKNSPYGINGGQEIVNDIVYEGTNARMSPITVGGLGNKYEEPATSGDENYAIFNKVPLDNNAKGRRLAITSRVRSEADRVGLFHYSSWEFGKSFIQYNNKVVEPAKKGSYYLKLDNLDSMVFNRWLSFDTDVNTLKYNFRVVDVDTTNKTIKLSSPLPFDIPAGYTLKSRPPRYGFTFPRVNLNLKPIDWTLTSNTTILEDFNDYDYMERPQALRELITAYGVTHTDDIKMGYAPSVVVYRDNKELYKGSESTFLDSSAVDKVSPNNVDINSIKTNMEMLNTNTSERKLLINFDSVTDNESIFTYNIKSVGKNGESPLSKTINMDMASGVKGYSYIIDKSSSTIPNNIVNLTSTNIEQNINDDGVYYLHIKAMDNAGNPSDSIHFKIDIPKLTAEEKPNENMIRLDWILDNKDDKIFKIYQKKEESDEFQSISATNLSENNGIKVLQIYPNTTCSLTPIAETTFTNWKGETFTIPITASLKKWMEEPNVEDSKGYGKGLISVDLVENDEYNLNPNKYLKNSDGSWKYDVVTIGIGDCNGLKGLSESSKKATTEYIDSGRGFFFGHDSIYKDEGRKYTGELAYEKMKIQLTGKTQYRGTQVTITKKGLLTNYPWNIGEVGTVLNIPESHTSTQVPNSINDIWMKYSNGKDSIENFYLTSYNNLAFSQTGHSTGKATPDEQKILANTLFYLNQLSSQNYLNDRSGQDTKAPTKPTVSNHKFTDNGEIEINVNQSEDIGSKYEYYVQSENKNGKELTLSTVKSAEIKSGLKGYSYIIDSNADTIPDNIVDMTSNKAIKTKIDNSKELYVHIKAIDNADNSSETLHYRISDMIKPKLELTLSPNSWTNGNVTINAKATDNDSGIKSIILPNGNVINSTTASYSVNFNGIYYFKAIDRMGNEILSAISVSNIDKKNPTVIIQNNTNWTNKDVEVIIIGTDN